MIVKERFERFVMPEPNSGCWLWLGGLFSSGYGMMKIKGKQRLVHRVAWEIFNGDIPTGLCVLHQCDTKSCVNPKHLFLGTNRDNSQDCIHKGRWRIKGKTLSENEVHFIRRSDERQTDLADRFGVTQSAISRIKTLENHKGLPW